MKNCIFLLAFFAGVASADQGVTRSTVYRVLEETGLIDASGTPTGGGATPTLNAVLTQGASTGGKNLNITAGDLVLFGGATSAFPALKRSGTTLQARLGNDAEFAPVQLFSLTGPTSDTFYIRSPSAAFANDVRVQGGSGANGNGAYIDLQGSGSDALEAAGGDRTGTNQSAVARFMTGSSTGTGTASIEFWAAAPGTTGTSSNSQSKVAMIREGGSFVLNATGSSLAQNSTRGFTYLPRCATGAPSGTPVSFTGAGATVIGGDNHLYSELTSGAFSRIDLGTDSTPTFTSLTLTSGLTLTGTTITGAPTWSSSQAITLSTAAQTNITSVGTLSGLTLAAAGVANWSGRARLSSSADGIIELENAAATDFTRLCFGGTTASFPSLKRSTTSLHARLADDSGFASFQANDITANGNVNVTAQLLMTTSTNLVWNSDTSLTRLSATTLQVGDGGVNASGVLLATQFGISTRSRITCGTDGHLNLTDNAGTSFIRLNLGPSTSSFPSIKRNAAKIDIRLGDDSGYADLTASNILANGNLQCNASTSLVGRITVYNNISAVGLGVPAIYGQGRFNAQTGAKASVATYTPAADGSFDVCANVLITTATSHTFTVTCTYTDEGNTARTATLSFMRVAGGTPDTSIVNANGAVPYQGIPIRIRAKASTAITIQTVGTFGTVTYNVEGTIIQVSA